MARRLTVHKVIESVLDPSNGHESGIEDPSLSLSIGSERVSSLSTGCQRVKKDLGPLSLYTWKQLLYVILVKP